MGTVCGSPWFPPSPQLILGEDYVTPGLTEQTGRLLEDTCGSNPGFISLFLQGRAVPGTVLCWALMPGRLPGVGTPWHTRAPLPAAAHLEMCSMWGALKAEGAVQVMRAALCGGE